MRRWRRWRLTAAFNISVGIVAAPSVVPSAIPRATCATWQQLRCLSAWLPVCPSACQADWHPALLTAEAALSATTDVSVDATVKHSPRPLRAESLNSVFSYLSLVLMRFCLALFFASLLHKCRLNNFIAFGHHHHHHRHGHHHQQHELIGFANVNLHLKIATMSAFANAAAQIQTQIHTDILSYRYRYKTAFGF